MGCGTSSDTANANSPAAVEPSTNSAEVEACVQRQSPSILPKDRHQDAPLAGHTLDRQRSSEPSPHDTPIREEELFVHISAQDSLQEDSLGEGALTAGEESTERCERNNTDEWKSLNELACDSPVSFSQVFPSGHTSSSRRRSIEKKHMKAIDLICFSAAVDEFAAEGSSSTARLSVYSGSSTDTFALPTIRSSEPRLAFFSASILAPHAPHDAIELQRRLTGGYIDSSSGITYLAPTQRWEALHQETSGARDTLRTPPPFLSGAGVLWVSLTDGRGLPAALPTPTSRAEVDDSSPHVRKKSSTRIQLKLYQNLLSSVPVAIPTFEEELLADCDIASYTVQQCAVRVKELYSWCNETTAVNPNYQRLRVILGELQISLRDTAILLEDPKRYLEAFARIDPQGLMFQAEVLSLQDERVKMMMKSKAVVGSESSLGPQRRSPNVQSVTLNPLQESFLEDGDDDVRLTARKARDILSMMVADHASSPTAASTASDPLSPPTSITVDQQSQLQTALRLFRQRAFMRLRYIALVLRNAVEIETFCLRQ